MPVTPELSQEEMNELYLTADECKLSKLVKESNNITNVLNMIHKQSLIRPSSISRATVDTMSGYIDKIDEMDAEIKTLLLRNTYLLPEGINRDNYDEWKKEGGVGVCDRWDTENGGVKRG
jgi:hypothetical protein